MLQTTRALEPQNLPVVARCLGLGLADALHVGVDGHHALRVEADGLFQRSARVAGDCSQTFS